MASTPQQQKKLQQSFKKAVHSFGKLLCFWQNDCNEILTLLQSLQSLGKSIISVVKTSKCIHPVKTLQIFKQFPSIAAKIVSKIIFDVEKVFEQILLIEYVFLNWNCLR